MNNIEPIISEIELVTGIDMSQHQLSPVSGGSINTAYRVQTAQHSYFIKLNQPKRASMFEAEVKGLTEMRGLDFVRIPGVVCNGQTEHHSYLVLEYIEISSLHDSAAKLLGTQLAQLHRHTQPFFGWYTDNTIGSTPQYNNREHDWATFWKKYRLGPQLEFASQNGFNGNLQSQGALLLEQLHHFFDGYTPSPSLLHGDLWSGNAAADSHGNPVIFDPACYYGDRESDIAMTELFGGFDLDFYNAYQAEYPLDSAYKTRKTLYNLHHILNHLNLFAGSYLGQAENMINQLLAEIK